MPLLLTTADAADPTFLLAGVLVIGLIVLAGWLWKRYRIARWPTVPGHVERVRIGDDKSAYSPWGFRSTQPAITHTVVLEYRYEVAGRRYRGLHQTGFSDKSKAYEFARRFQRGTEIDIEYNPRNPVKTIVDLPGDDLKGIDEQDPK